MQSFCGSCLTATSITCDRKLAQGNHYLSRVAGFGRRKKKKGKCFRQWMAFRRQKYLAEKMGALKTKSFKIRAKIMERTFVTRLRSASTTLYSL